MPDLELVPFFKGGSLLLLAPGHRAPYWGGGAHLVGTPGFLLCLFQTGQAGSAVRGNALPSSTRCAGLLVPFQAKVERNEHFPTSFVASPPPSEKKQSGDQRLIIPLYLPLRLKFGGGGDTGRDTPLFCSCLGLEIALHQTRILFLASNNPLSNVLFLINLMHFFSLRPAALGVDQIATSHYACLQKEIGKQ